MKRKNYIFSLASALLMGTLAMSLTACSSEDIVANNTQQPAQGEVRTYTVSIPATFSDNAGTRAVAFDNSGSTPAITTKFVEGEKVYVYNNTESALLGGYLVVKNVSADMKSCELQGQLTGTINADDEVVLYYNLNVINSPSDPSDVHYIYYNYDGQVGTAASCVDGAMATMKVKEIDASNNYKMTFYAVSDATKTQAKAEFDNLQSMFRFQFADATAPTTPIKVKTLNIQSKNTALANRYYPLITTDPYYPVTGGIDIKPETATADYLYVGLCIRERSASDDVLYFWVTDDEGNEYRGSKSAPTGGFANGKYYYNSAPIALTKQPAKAAPVITWTNPSVAVTPSEYPHKYTFETTYPGSADITIANASGKDYCSGYAFEIKNNATIRLNAVNAIWNYQDSPFIYVYNVADAATLVLTGDNTISCNGNDYAIDCTTLKLSCTGNSATLTVKTKTAQGMHGGTNYYSAPYQPENNFVVSNLAANGYTVERTGGTSPDADGVYTTTYTVAVATLSAATTADHGKVVCAAGHLHDAKTAVPTGCTAVGILGKVTETGHGLILALKDAAQQEWNTINGWASKEYASTTLKALPADALGNSLTNYTRLGSTTVSGWAVAQKDDYVAIFTNLGSTTGNENGKTYDDNVNDYITTGVGGTEISGIYWSATESSTVDGAQGFASDYWLPLTKSSIVSVRPVLGF